MKQQSERTLILAGSLFLVGLIIADVLTQHLNQLELFNEETKSALLVSSSNHADAHPAAQKNKYEKQSENKLDTRYRDKVTTDTANTSASGLRNSKKQKTFLAEITPPPPVQSNNSANDNELPFDQVGLEGKYECVTSDIPQTQFHLFHNALNPHGRWFRHSKFGTCWIPQESQKNPQWRPFLNQGKWTYTNLGWLWHSDYHWGAYPFHYGRWFHTSKGWAWKPEGSWSTAWVTWRNASEYCGWAPLPPIQKNPQHATPSKEKSKPNSAVCSPPLSEKYFVFLPKKHLLETSLDAKILNAEKARLVFQYSKPADRFARGKDQRIGNHGIPANRLLPWMQTGLRNQAADQKVSAAYQTNHGPNVSSPNAGRATYQKRLWTQSPSLQGPATPGQIPANIQSTPQGRMNNMKQAEQK